MRKADPKRSKESPSLQLSDLFQEIINFLTIHSFQRRSMFKSNLNANQSVEEKVFRRDEEVSLNVKHEQIAPKASENPDWRGNVAGRRGNVAGRRGNVAGRRDLVVSGPSTSSNRAIRVWIRTSIAFLLLGAITHSLIFALIAGALVFFMPVLKARQSRERRKRELIHAWPEILDLMISGLHSGLSIAETIEGLESRGPEITRELFKQCKEKLRSDGDMRAALRLIKAYFNEAMADQICEVLDFARSTGSRDTTLTLRTLGNYIRSEIATKEEIRVKHGWIRNSAAVASIAPWLLLSVLWLQPNTRAAYSTSAGAVVLLVGVTMSLLAFLWMHRAGRIPESPRVFE